MVVGASPKTAMEVVKGKDLSGKIAVVTGGNSGIGLETVRTLAYAGAEVYYTARSMETGQKVQQTEFQDSRLSGKTHLLHLDLADLSSVQNVAKQLQNLQRIDYLILNAGIMACPYGQTKHGFEKQFGINVIGHFYLEQLLEKKLVSQATPSRIIILSSVAHQFGWIDLKDLHYRHGRSYWSWPAYGQSKMGDLLWAKDLGRRLSGTNVTVFSIHPGNIYTNLQKYLFFGLIIFVLMSWLRVTKSTQQGAATSVWAATTPGIEKHTGSYCEDCRVSEPVKYAQNPKLANDLCNTIQQQLDSALRNGKFE